MGYESCMHFCAFRTKYTTQEEINSIVTNAIHAIRHGVLEKHGVKELEFIEEYEFELQIHNNEFHIELIPEDHCQKHYDDFALAFIISLLIKEGEIAELLFDGEDGESWGYRITSFKVEAMHKVWEVMPDSETEFTKKELVKCLI